MTDELVSVLQDIVRLLSQCGQAERAKWFTARLDALKNAHRSERERIVKELHRIAAGMGSFADLPLKPSSESGLSQKQADDLQWDLADRLGMLTR